MTSPPRPDALVFDLDGTLVDSRGDIARACNAMLARHGRPPLPLEEVVTMIGDGARVLVARALAATDRRDAENARLLDEALESFAEAYRAHPVIETTLLPGARSALSTGLPNGLVTNKPRDVTLLVLDALGIASSFAAVWGGGDGPLKPAPAGILAVVERLGVKPAATWVIGDGPQDVAAANAAGCTSVAVPGIAERAALLAAGPSLVIESLDEIPRLVGRV